MPAAGSSRPLIAFAPIGQIEAESLAPLLALIDRSFACQAVLVPGLPLPERAFDRRRGQYHSTTLLEGLAAHKQPEQERLLGVVDVDLYVPELHFVFGEANPRRRVALFSLVRLHAGLGQADVFLRRAATEVEPATPPLEADEEAAAQSGGPSGSAARAVPRAGGWCLRPGWRSTVARPGRHAAKQRYDVTL